MRIDLIPRVSSTTEVGGDGNVTSSGVLSLAQQALAELGWEDLRLAILR